MDVRVGLWRKLRAKEWMLLNCGVGEDSRVPWTAEIQPVHPKGDQPWVFIGRTDVEAETPILWPPDANWLTRKDHDAGKDRSRRRRGQSIRASASASVLPKNLQDWFPICLTGLISLQSKGLSRVFSNTTVLKHQFFGAQPSSQSNSHIHTWPLEKP